MKTFTAIALITFAGTALAAKPGSELPPPEPEQPAQIAFVGFSDAVLNGGQGFITMHDACDATVAGARMCTSQQFIESPTYAAASGLAWIRFTAAGYGDPTGVGNGSHQALTCVGWNVTSSSYRGLVVDGNGRFKQGQCHLSLPVACCL